jgi:hypothetical protein
MKLNGLKFKLTKKFGSLGIEGSTADHKHQVHS